MLGRPSPSSGSNTQPRPAKIHTSCRASSPVPFTGTADVPALEMGQDQGMESHERQSAKDRLALLQLLMTAHERRHEVIDAVWDARDEDEDEAAERLRGLLGATADPRVILDSRLGRLAVEGRKRLAGDADELRRLLGQE